jgi:hypothetical protein
MGPLLVRANQDPSLGSELSGRLSGLADSVEHQPEGRMASPDPGVVADGPSLTDEAIAEHLEGLERVLALRSAEEGGASDAPA